MLSFLTKLFPSLAAFGAPSEHQEIIDRISRTQNCWNIKLEEFGGGKEVSELDPREKCRFVLSLLKNFKFYISNDYVTRRFLALLLRQKLPFEHDEIIRLLVWSTRQRSNYERNISEMIKILDRHLQENPLTEELKIHISALIKAVASDYQNTADIRQKIVRLREFAEISSLRNPLNRGEAWSEAALDDIQEMSGELQTSWNELIYLCQTSNGGAPKAKWLKNAFRVVERIGFESFKTQIIKWFPLVDKPRTTPVKRGSEWSPDPNLMLDDVNADILKGLIWLCGEREDREIARALFNLAISAYKKVPQAGPRCVRVGNACVWALGAMPGAEAVGQLTLLRHKVKGNSVQNLIAQQIQKAADRLNLSPEEVEEISVPDYGLTEVGLARETFGDFKAELVVTGTNAAEIRWTNAEGKPQKTVPKHVRDNYAEELKELNQAVKDIKKMLPAQRDRFENFYLEHKSLDFKTWRERYLEHPLIGTIARRLIWRFDETTTAIWFDGKMVDKDGCEMNFFDDTRVELWHPIHSATEEVLDWQEFLSANVIRQPFKQAHREIYLLTDAERNTRVYSNRFAAHIIKQHQFNALCATRGWKNALWIMADMEVPPASRAVKAYNLRAEFWTEPIGENYDTDASESGAYLYLTTDQVRFYPINAAATDQAAPEFYDDNYIAGGIRRHFEPIPLERIPPIVFSEIMRDADLFVGVCSIGNDPNWLDGGGNTTRYAEYWQNYSFGDLSESAKTRR
ncbi:MAG TPA: DUF4132 domain-containing protein, partial [Pyrinomonadaceae bacterium]|nr:DUF4132 domain-containing protein [Pyrinomonadaceae bacterium]